jgi:hypothetical protein
MKKNKVVYTALIGRGDRLQKINFKTNNDIDYICFTNYPDQVPKGWMVIAIDKYFKKNYLEPIIREVPISKHNDPTIINRIIKMHPHIFLKNYKKSMYVDSHIRLKKCMSDFIEDSLVNANWLSPPHRWGGDTYIETYRCYENDKIDKNEFDEFSNKIKVLNIPPEIPFPENGIILRNHLDECVQNMCKQWWQFFKDGPYRDQLHWQQAFIKTAPKFKYLSYRFTDNNPHFALGKHKGWFFMVIKKKIIKIIKKIYTK